MEHIELTLNENKSFSSINEIQNIGVELENNEKLLPVTDLQDTIDAYEQYLKEKDACNKFRLIFTIRPYCTNVLFNRITEGVYHEGRDDAMMFLMEKDANEFGQQQDKHGNYFLGYASPIAKKISNQNNKYVTSPITRDGGYTSDGYYDSNIPDEYNLNYNCGIDIFNNHLLRKKEFVCINTYSTSSDNDTNKWRLNTLFDSVRDPWGCTLTGLTYNDATGTTELHIYHNDNIYSFNDAISHNLHEENGWFGFYNTTLPTLLRVFRSVPDSTSETTQDGANNETRNSQVSSRLLNNKTACSFVDLYPTREHFSFVPHYNANRKRSERNWEYMLMYPYANDYNYLVYDSVLNVSGILCDLDLYKITLEQLLGMDASNPVNTPLIVTFHAHLKHTLLPGDRINLHVYNVASDDETPIVHTAENVVVSSVGKNGYSSQNYFSVQLNDILTVLNLSYDDFSTNAKLKFRFEKCSNDRVCKYYLRKFKKLPNFKNTIVSAINGITDEEINSALEKTDFNSSLNKLGFSKTIYGDDLVQIVYNDDIDVSGLKDNLGRELSVLYLTIVKTNNGYQKWYNTNPQYGDESVEFSHCFGNLSSGFDLAPDVTEYVEMNVRKQHNISPDLGHYDTGLTPSAEMLESGITSDWRVLYGDIVELDENKVEETVLEPVYHRFNTAQREYEESDTFKNLVIDYIKYDDYESTKFTPAQMGEENMEAGQIVPNAMCHNTYANLAPEGYFYQPHYPIRIKEYDTTVNTGYHTKITFELIDDNTIETDKNYFLETNGKLYVYSKKTPGYRYIAYVESVGGDDFTEVTVRFDENSRTLRKLGDITILKPNVLMPNTAYDFNDESGRYVWREVLPTSKIPRTSELYDSIFTNGAIYLHKDINFYLKRQDPYGEYGLQPKTQLRNVTTTFKLTIPSPEPGTKIRITFDGVRDASLSSYYIEGTYNNIQSGLQPVVNNVFYQNVVCDNGSTWNGTTSQGNIFDTFTINNFTIQNDLALKKMMFWVYDEQNSEWQMNNEFGAVIVTYHEDDCMQYAELEVLGEEKDVTTSDYIEPGQNKIC